MKGGYPALVLISPFHTIFNKTCFMKIVPIVETKPSNKKVNKRNWENFNFSENNPYKGLMPIGANKGQQYFDLLSNAQIWESNQAEKVRQDKYNDALHQSAREREAGVNPDLAGISGAPASTDAGTGVENSPITPADTGVGFGMNVAQTLLGLASSMFSLPGSVASLGESVVKTAGNLYNYHADTVADVIDLMSAGLIDTQNAPEVAKAFFPNSKRGQKRFLNSYQQIYDSMGSKLAAAKNEKEFNEVTTSIPYSNPELLQHFNELILQNTASKAEFESLMSQLRLSWSEAHKDDIQEGMTQELNADTAQNKLAAETAAATDGKVIGAARTSAAGTQFEVSEATKAGARANKAIAEMDKFIAENTDLDVKASSINQQNETDFQRAVIESMDAQTMIDARNYLYRGRAGRREAFEKGWNRKQLRELRKKNRNLNRERGIQSRFARTMESVQSGVNIGTSIANSAAKFVGSE